MLAEVDEQYHLEVFVKKNLEKSDWPHQDLIDRILDILTTLRED